VRRGARQSITELRTNAPHCAARALTCPPAPAWGHATRPTRYCRQWPLRGLKRHASLCDVMHVTLAHGCPAWRARRRRSTSPANAPSQSMRCGQPTTARHHAACAPWQPPYKAGDRARRAATRTTMRARAGRGPSGAPPLAVLGGARLALMVDMRGWRPAGGDAHQQDTRGRRGKAQRQGGPARISMTFRPSPDAHHALGRRAWPAQRWSTGPTGALPRASRGAVGPHRDLSPPPKRVQRHVSGGAHGAGL